MALRTEQQTSYKNYNKSTPPRRNGKAFNSPGSTQNKSSRRSVRPQSRIQSPNEHSDNNFYNVIVQNSGF